MERIFPFFWVTGKKADFKAEIAAMAQCGIKSFCVESRIHPDFCGDGWWRDFDEILRYAEEFDMTVWVLDDKRYPTGYCNYKVEENPHLRQWHLVADHYDFISDGFTVQLQLSTDEEDVLLGAFAIPYLNGSLQFCDAIDITNNKQGRWLICDLPKGEYRYVRIYQSRRGSEYDTPFIDMLSPDSVDLLINEVYEKFYQRYAPLFGKRIVGFFSDEPRVGSGYTQLPLVKNTPREHTMGIVGAAYPYSKRVIELMQEKIPTLSMRDLLGIWYDTDNAAVVRCAFMDAVTREYAKHFSGRIGAWCKAHGVSYAGHIIEDMNAHTATWRSVGHYFRSQQGQDLAGVDVVLHQTKAYSINRNTIGKTFGGMVSPTFYLHTLPMLAVSEAWLDSKKRGSLCELFGAYGWGESMREMKWMLDSMLASGIDHFIPHAFCAELDNDDCPPHFYEGGKNPLYLPFVSLIGYMQRILQLTQNKFKPKVGVLYHAEAEWSGQYFTMADGVCRKLHERQIPFIIVPQDKLAQANLELLIVPDCEYLPSWAQENLQKAQASGTQIIYDKEADYFALAGKYQGVCKTDGTASGLFILDGENPMFFQTGEAKPIQIRVDTDKPLCLYDPMNEIYQPVDSTFILHLQQGETRILLQQTAEKREYSHTCPHPTTFTLSKKQDGKLTIVQENASVGSVNKLLPDYSGEIVYECKICLEEGEYEWDFNAIGGCLKLTIDGNDLGFRFVAPAKYRVQLGAGEHTIAYHFLNTLGNEKFDTLSVYKEMEAFGLLQLPTVKKA